MKQFESFLARELEEYVSYRQGLGYRDCNLRTLLRPFDRYISAKGTDCLSDFKPLYFLEFREDINSQGSTVNGILTGVRGFFQYLVRKGLFAANPLQDIPARAENAFIPFIFAPGSVNQLLKSVQNNIRKTDDYFFRDFTVYLAIILLARCGLRISEPLKLQLQHYRHDEKTIYIEKTKFNKDRLIPIPLAVASEIDNYLAVRKKNINNQNKFILVGANEGPLPTRYIYLAFNQAVKEIGLAVVRKIIANTTFGAPTPHSLRHSFATNTLKDIKLRGDCPQKALPVLAAYMGHRKYRYTALYLKMLDAEQRQNLVNFSITRQEDI